MQCQGLCKPTNFWFFRPLTDGQPPKSCAIAIKENFDQSFGLIGWGVMFTLFFTCILLFCSFGLCRSKKTLDKVNTFWEGEEFDETGRQENTNITAAGDPTF